MKYRELSEKIIGCAMKVHKYFGPGYPEIVYKRALVIEVRKVGINVLVEPERDIFYEGGTIYKRRIDLLAEEVVLIELKAQKEIDNATINQILNCLKVFDLEVGLLLNFGAPSLFYKRFIYDKNFYTNP